MSRLVDKNVTDMLLQGGPLQTLYSDCDFPKTRTRVNRHISNKVYSDKQKLLHTMIKRVCLFIFRKMI
jgi:hypothetical protein